MTVRPIHSLSLDEIRAVARDLAEAGEQCHHGFAPATTQAIAFERSYIDRQRELQPQED